jgi:hypothetical protein
MSRCRDLNPGPLPYQGSALPLSYNGKIRAGNGTQTRDPQLGRLMLYQLSYSRNLSLSSHQGEYPPTFRSKTGYSPDFKLWAVMDSNHRKLTLAELQSAPFGHSGNCPFTLSKPSPKTAAVPPVHRL